MISRGTRIECIILLRTFDMFLLMFINLIIEKLKQLNIVRIVIHQFDIDYIGTLIFIISLCLSMYLLLSSCRLRPLIR